MRALCPMAPPHDLSYHRVRAPGNRTREEGKVNVYSQLKRQGVNPDRLLEFILTFARVEYALKASGFLQSREEGEGARPDWPCFQKSLRSTFRSDARPELRAACEYLLRNPPHREVVSSDGLEWEPGPPSDDLPDPEVDKVLQCVRRVRNNLFHGGKFSTDPGSPGRDVDLIDNSLVVLRAVARLGSIKKAYESARLFNKVLLD